MAGKRKRIPVEEIDLEGNVCSVLPCSSNQILGQRGEGRLVFVCSFVFIFLLDKILYKVLDNL